MRYRELRAPRPATESFDPDWVSWLTEADLRAWAMYELENRRANAAYDLEADDEYWRSRTAKIRYQFDGWVKKVP